MANDFSFPTSPSFEDAFLPDPPKFKRGREQKFLKQVDAYLNSLFLGITDMGVAIRNGYLIDGIRLSNVQADQVLANSILTETLTIGSSENITLNGNTQKITVKDNNGQNRVVIGRIGSGSTNWGIQLFDDGGSLVGNISSLAAFEWAIIDNVAIQTADIVDAAITNAKIANLAVGSAEIQSAAITNAKIGTAAVDTAQIANAAITNALVDNLSASKLTVIGTLTVNSSLTQIAVTGAGATIFSNGADIIMRASASGNTSYMKFQTSGSSDRGILLYSVSGNYFQVGSASNVDMRLSAGTGEIQLQSDWTVPVSSLASDITPTTDNTYDLGAASRRFADIRSVLINGADIGHDNESYWTEPYMIWTEDTMDRAGIFPDDGIVFVTNDEVARVMIGKEGIRTQDSLPDIDKDSPTIKQRKKKTDEYTLEDGKWQKIKRLH